MILAFSRGSAPAPFTLLGAVTPATSASTVSTLISNQQTFATDDLLLAIGAAPQATARAYEPPTPNWGAPGETWTERVDDSAVVGSNLIVLGVSTAPAAAGQTNETVDINFSGTMFGIIGAFLKVPGSSIVRQVSPVAKVEDGTTTIATTFSSAILSTSHIIALCAQRVSTDGIVNPTSFSQISNASATASSRLRIVERIGHDSTTVSWSGLSSTSLAKIAVAIEIARPGQEI